jgi:hypothetical protein
MSDLDHLNRGLFDRAGEPIDFERWSLLFQDKRYQQIASDTLHGYLVSTVWLGIDHGWGFTREPVIFETMVFNVRDAPYPDVEQRRYCTEEQARAGHAEVVNEVELIARAELDPQLEPKLREGSNE